jgi:hypothetical protein
VRPACRDRLPKPVGGSDILSLLIGVIVIAIPFFVERRWARRTLQNELYQRLELASIDLFRWEAGSIQD